MAEKTGYPEDMLEMDLDLEADLGVDTVKQAETFAAVREAYGIARQENLKLRDFPTLKHVVQFVYDFRPDLRPCRRHAPCVRRSRWPPEGAVAGPRGSSVQGRPLGAPRDPPRPRLEDADRMPRRVPVPSLRPPLDWCKPTGVALGKGDRVVVAADEGGVAAALARVLEERGVAVLSLARATPTEEVDEPSRRLAEGRPDPGRLLAARSRRRARPSRTWTCRRSARPIAAA